MSKATIKKQVRRKNQGLPDMTYDDIKAAMVKRGTTLRRWALLRELPVTSVYGAASRQRAGIEAIKILNKLEEFIHGN